MTDIANFDWTQLTTGLKNKAFSSRELTQAYLRRIEALDPTLGSFLHLSTETALKAADASDARRTNGTLLSPLDGLPIALKDIFVTQDIPTTCASRLLEGYIPPYSSTVASRLEAAGTVLLGKLNMDEFAMGSSNENSAYKVVRNPWDLNCVPGGSSGGSSAAVAASLCAASVGTDTGGSIRQPAALCGISGIKPTYGRVSRYGMIAFASSLDQAGPMAYDVATCAAMLEAMAGHDPHDATSAQMDAPRFELPSTSDLQGLKIGLPAEFFGEGLDAEVQASLDRAIETLRSMGAELIPVSLPHTSYAVATYYIVATAEASSNLARYDGIRLGQRKVPEFEDGVDVDLLTELYERTRSEGFGAEVKRRILLGTYVLSSGYYDAYYLKAQKVRTLIRQDFEKAFEQCDLLLAPTTPTPAFGLGENLNNPLQMYLSDILTISCNLAGLPGMSVPCGLTSNNLPIGMQLLGPAFREDVLFHVGHAWQLATDWHKQRPALAL